MDMDMDMDMDYMKSCYIFYINICFNTDVI